MLCAGWAPDKGGRLMCPAASYPHLHPRKTKPCAWEGSPGVANPFQAHSYLGTLGTPCPPGGDEGGSSSALCSHLPTRKWHHLLNLAEGLGRRRRKHSPSGVVSLPLPAQLPALGRLSPPPSVLCPHIYGMSDLCVPPPLTPGIPGVIVSQGSLCPS